ncbi:MAG: metallophosphoesterase [Patescibacteria group bacterium]|nr:metallophosphoesterase [Patescibacteria group bacterium]MDD5490223.1 metallophosphoesterase [Patescibacteria group bacterium]
MTYIYFDIIIFTYLFLTALLSFLFWQKIKQRQGKKIIWQILITLTIFSGLVIFYGSFIEPRIITVKNKYLDINPNSDNTVTIALLSDIHVGPFKKSGFVNKISSKLLALNPDLIFFAGDQVFGGYDKIDGLKNLAPATERIPSYAVSGNHEYDIGRIYEFNKFIDKSSEVQDIFESIGANYLSNESRLINIRDSQFWLLGIDDVWAGLDNMEHALKYTDNNYPKIVLAHSPDIMRTIIRRNRQVALILCGHTHGGQIRLPFIGSVPTIPTFFGRQYDKGLFKIKNYLLYITSGIGESGTRARLFNPPEIVLLHIKI